MNKLFFVTASSEAPAAPDTLFVRKLWVPETESDASFMALIRGKTKREQRIEESVIVVVKEKATMPDMGKTKDALKRELGDHAGGILNVGGLEDDITIALGKRILTGPMEVVYD